MEIFREQGISGFFAGIFPRLVGDISCLVLVSASSFVFNKYVLQEPETQKYFISFAQFLFSSFFYPMHVVSTCMIVSGSGLIAGKPPLMPNYSSWRECWNHLNSSNSLKRGSSLFLRYYRPNISKKNLLKPPFPEIVYNAY